MNLLGRNSKGQFTSQGLLGSNNFNWVGGKVSVICGNCGKTFPVVPARVRKREIEAKPERFFCGRKCMGVWRKKNYPGAGSPSWRGGITKDKNGYIRIHLPNHPRAQGTGYVYEHLLVAEAKYGEVITSDWHVHHLNGVKGDNRSENLVRLRPKDHDRHTVVHLLQKRILELEKQLSEIR